MKLLQRLSVAVLMFPLILVPEAARAHYFRKDITLTAKKNFQQQPTVHSYTFAELLTNDGLRIYNAQVILGHEVGDRTDGRSIFTAQIVTELGYANSTTRDLTTGEDMAGQYNHCYAARMIAHANAFNLHQGQDAEDSCIGPPPAQPEVPEKYTPVILDLDMDGFHLTGPVPAVSFDLNADGTPERTAWTRAGEDDAFLCMDRNGNGVIDDGSELFGSATPLVSGETAESGYYALAELDEPAAGGNSDGKVDAADSQFGSLCAWLDENRDGVSQRQEIYSLQRAGVVAFERRFKKMHKEDDFGNLFRYTSRVDMASPGGSVTSWPTFDVIFAVP